MMENVIAVSMPVTAATLMEDRALVERTFVVKLPAGVSRLTYDKASPLMVGRTMTGQVLAGTAQVKGVSFNIAHRLQPKDEKRAKSLPEELCKIRDLLFVTEMEERRLRHLKEECNNYLALWQEQIQNQVVREVGQHGDWVADYQYIYRHYRDYLRQWQEKKRQLGDIFEEYDRLSLENSQASSLEPHYDGQINILVEAEAETMATIKITGIMACVAWRPIYRAQLMGDHVNLTRGAMVWQQSGEDWSDCELKFSTARPNKGVEIPRLKGDRIILREKQEEERKVVKVTSQEVEVADSAAAGFCTVLPGVDDGGSAQLYSLPNKVTLLVGAGGQPFDIDTQEVPVTVALEATPEMGAEVSLVARGCWPEQRPILSGPVLLQRDDCYIGRSLMDFTGPGQAFSWGFGSEDEMTIVREALPVRKQAEGSKTRYEYHIKDILKNIGQTVRDVKVTERIPVSENAEVTVNLEKTITSAGYQVDENGFVTWQETIAPGEQKILELLFTVTTGKHIEWQH